MGVSVEWSPTERIVEEHAGHVCGEPAWIVEYETEAIAFARSILAERAASGEDWAKVYLARLDSKTA